MSSQLELGATFLGGQRALDRCPGERTMHRTASTAWQLLIVNILLQVFDGVATYNGLHGNIGEHNPLLRMGFEVFGVAPCLLLLKSSACAVLAFVYQALKRRPTFAQLALGAVATVYVSLSLMPWLAVFATRFAQAL